MGYRAKGPTSAAVLRLTTKDKDLFLVIRVEQCLPSCSFSRGTNFSAYPTAEDQVLRATLLRERRAATMPVIIAVPL